MTRRGTTGKNGRRQDCMSRHPAPPIHMASSATVNAAAVAAAGNKCASSANGGSHRYPPAVSSPTQGVTPCRRPPRCALLAPHRGRCRSGSFEGGSPLALPCAVIAWWPATRVQRCADVTSACEAPPASARTAAVNEETPPAPPAVVALAPRSPAVQSRRHCRHGSHGAGGGGASSGRRSMTVVL